MERQLVVFELAQEWYGVDILAVKSIIRMRTITTIPHAPKFVEGIINLRNFVLPVIDLRKRFNLPVNPVSYETRIIVVEMGQAEVGIIVDAVIQVLRISTEAIEIPSSLLLTGDSNCISGLARASERLVNLLDLGKILTLEEQVHVARLEPVVGS